MPFCRLLLLVSVIAATAARGDEMRRTLRQEADGTAAANPMFGPWFGESEAERQALEEIEIDPREERRIGEAMLEELLTSLKRQGVRVTTRGKDVEYVEGLVSQIRPRMEHADRYTTIQVYWADSTETDARAFPGGSIVVMRGLVDFVKNEAALVGVLGHELSHIDHGHQLRTARAANIAQHGWDFRNTTPQDIERNIMIMSKNFAKPFNSDDEAVADRDGATWAFELGYDPIQLAEVFRGFEKNRRGARSRQAQVPAFLRTHPYDIDRYQAVRDLSAQLQADHPDGELFVGRRNLEMRVPKQVRKLPE